MATLTPEVRTLIATLERQLDRLERRADSLEARYRLLEGRVEWYLSARPFLAQEAHNDDNGEYKEVEGKKKELRLRQLKTKKERLGSVVARLEEQAKQKEGELRKSIEEDDY